MSRFPQTTTIDPHFEERVGEVMRQQDLMLPGTNLEFATDDMRANYETWFYGSETFHTSGGVWLEIDRQDPGIWWIHFAPYVLVKEEIDGEVVEGEAQIYEARSDQKYTVMLAGITGLMEYITLVEASYLPKPDIICGATNRTMANFSRRLGFDVFPETDIDYDGEETYYTSATYEELKAGTLKFKNKFGKKLVSLGLREMEAAGIH